MTAYCRIGLFDIDLFYALETSFTRKIEQADGQTLVTMFVAHSIWGAQVVQDCLVEKNQKRRVYTYFKKYNEEFYDLLILNLLRCFEEINLKGIFMVLAHGNKAHLKKRSNIRKVLELAVRGITNLREEKSRVNNEEVFNLLCIKYFEISNAYCLN